MAADLLARVRAEIDTRLVELRPAMAEYERLLDLARADTANDCRRVRDELVRRLDTLVVASAERVLGGRVDASRHRVLIDDAIATAARQS